MPRADGGATRSRPPILILGVPRSGTSWLHAILSAAPGVRSVHEPDNESERPWALVAKHGLGRFPALRRDEAPPRYEALWRDAFLGGPPPPRIELARKLHYHLVSFDAAEAGADPKGGPPLVARALGALGRPTGVLGPRRKLVKSVHAVLCADWLVERFAPATVVVRRDPVEVAASWRAVAALRERGGGRLEYAGDPARLFSPPAFCTLRARYGEPPSDRQRALTWTVGALTCELEAFAARRPAAQLVDFEAACLAPEQALRPVAERLGLEWTQSISARLRDLDRPGAGWDLGRETARVPGAWRRRLSASELSEIEAMLRPFR